MENQALMSLEISYNVSPTLETKIVIKGTAPTAHETKNASKTGLGCIITIANRDQTQETEIHGVEI